MRKIGVLLIPFLFVGCINLSKVDINNKLALVRITAKHATILGIKKLFKKEVDQIAYAELIREIIEDNVMPLLNGEGVRLSQKNVQLLIDKIPDELELLLEDAIELLMSNIKFDQQKELVLYVKAFFQGILDGCCRIIGENNAVGANSDSSAEINSSST